MDVEAVESYNGPTLTLSVKHNQTSTHNQTKTSVKTTNFELNPQKALRKKLSACDRELPVILKTTAGGTRVFFQAGSYEHFKETCISLSTEMILYAEISHLHNQFTKIAVEENRDRRGSRIELRVKVPRRFTINFYHTTSSLLVNGKQESSFMTYILPSVFSKMDSTTLRSLNT